jgi:HNH endonuclease
MSDQPMLSSPLEQDDDLLILDLPNGYRTTIEKADWPLVKDLTLYRSRNGYVYFSTWKNGKSQPRTLHGLLMGCHKGMHIDHINGNCLDNRRKNLRVVTPSANQVNRKKLNKNNTSGVRGVRYFPSNSRIKPWKAEIMVNCKNINLGAFATFEEAVAARRAGELKYYGEICPS